MEITYRITHCNACGKRFVPCAEIEDEECYLTLCNHCVHLINRDLMAQSAQMLSECEMRVCTMCLTPYNMPKQLVCGLCWHIIEDRNANANGRPMSVREAWVRYQQYRRKYGTPEYSEQYAMVLLEPIVAWERSVGMLPMP
jgi:hypothetical protein